MRTTTTTRHACTYHTTGMYCVHPCHACDRRMVQRVCTHTMHTTATLRTLMREARTTR